MERIFTDIENILLYRRTITRYMIKRNIDNNLDSFFLSLIAQLLELLLGTKLIISDNIIGRLIVLIPFALILAVQCRLSALAYLALIDRRSLDRSISCLFDVVKMFGDSFEIPAPHVQYRTIIHCDRSVIVLLISTVEGLLFFFFFFGRSCAAVGRFTL